MNTLHMMIGIPGSGKTTFANQLAQKLNIPIVSTDMVRNENPNVPEKEIWPIAYLKCAEALKSGTDVIFDATSITPDVRARLVNEVKKHSVDFIVGAYLIKTDIKTCYHRVRKRNEDPKERFLPPEVVYSYGSKLKEPTIEEGFSFINIINMNE